MNKQDIREHQIWRHRATGVEYEVICLAISDTPEDTVALRTRAGVCSGMSADELIETCTVRVMGWSS